MYSVEKTRGLSFIKRFDYFLFITVLALSIFGLVVLSSAVLTNPQGSRILMMQVAGLLMGVVLAFFISSIDYKDFKTLGVVFYIFSVLLLILVLFIGTGAQQVGTKGWFKIMGVNFQPSELAKITFVIISSVFFERISEGKDRKKNIIKLLFYSALPILLVLAQPDFGTSMVFIFMFIVMVFICGIPYKYILMAGGALVASLPLLWLFLGDYQRKRILVFFNPSLDPLGAGYHVSQSKLAIGSGQFSGKGLFNGPMTQQGSVPVRESDFIMSVIGEELGFIGVVIVIVFMMMILLRCIYIAKNSRDKYGSFIVIGLASMLAFHFIENVGMGIGLMPVTGIPLPFVSAGGSAMITNYIALGVILSVSMRRKKAIFNASQ